MRPCSRSIIRYGDRVRIAAPHAVGTKVRAYNGRIGTVIAIDRKPDRFRYQFIRANDGDRVTRTPAYGDLADAIWCYRIRFTADDAFSFYDDEIELILRGEDQP